MYLNKIGYVINGNVIALSYRKIENVYRGLYYIIMNLDSYVADHDTKM